MSHPNPNLRQLRQTDHLVWYTPHQTEFSVGTCYVAGPMTGYPSFNYGAFDAARDLLAAEGWDVISPADLDRVNLDIDFSVMKGTEDLSKYGSAFARQDISSLIAVDAVFLLDGWEKSTGATNEAKIATMLGVPVYTLNPRERVQIDARFSNAGVNPSIDADFLNRFHAWTVDTFGPGSRTLGVVDHIRKELDEILAQPNDIEEWADVILLALNGASRVTASPSEIIDAVRAKYAKNESRTWPDWRTQSADKAIEHDRSVD